MAEEMPGLVNTPAPPKRDEKIERVEYPDGTSCDVIFTKMVKGLPLEELKQVPREDAMNFNLEVPINTHTYDVNEHVICMQDCPVVMRDGVTIYVDIYLPRTSEKVPLIVSWSFFGKRPWEQPVSPMRPMGVPMGTVSDTCKFESSDPLFWCYQGYAVANADPRGIGNSEGDFQCFGTQDGRDGYDFIEWAAAQSWSNGRVGLFGNSGVAMSQWRVAAECPPHLSCIAPWEATGDMYRESLKEGGIPGAFGGAVVYGTAGRGFIDNMAAMCHKEPFVTSPYWQDKIPQFDKIKIPVYATACWNHFHLHGSWEGFNKIKSSKKWMRVHSEFEWPDTYNSKNLLDLKLFFDRYLKDIYNGWEITPRIRLEVMDAFNYSYQVDRPETRFPLERTVYKELYLNAADCTLNDELPAESAELSYDGETGEANFTYTFAEDTELTGHLKLRLYVEARGHDEMDFFAFVKKDSTDGEELPILLFGSERHPGSWGKLRTSARHLDEDLSTPDHPVHTFDRVEKLEPGQIVPIDIQIYPISRIWHKGQKLRVQVAGRYIRDEWFEPLIWFADNKGEHVIHTGGEYASHLLVPIIPPRYQDGEYTYR